MAGVGVPLTSFAGYFDKVLGVDYQDCYFEMPGLSAPVWAWLRDTVRGNNLQQILVVSQLDDQNNVVTNINISDGFLRDFRASDFDAATNAQGSLSFVVVPKLLQIGAGGDLRRRQCDPVRERSLRHRRPRCRRQEGLALRGIHLTAPKITSTPSGGGRRQFNPGPAKFDKVQLKMVNGGATTTAQDLDVRAANVSAGGSDRRNAVVTLLSAALAPIGELDLFGLLPLAALEPYPATDNRRSITLDVQRFEFPSQTPLVASGRR